jgi:anti-sigma factor ChrR (cupin superfamily)
VDHDKFRANLSAYRDGELNESLRDRIARHLQVCDACCEDLRELDRIDSLVRELPQIGASENFASEIIWKAQSGIVPRHRESSFPHRILDGFLSLADSVFELFPGNEFQGGSLDEFGDSPPLSLSHAYFQLIGR